MLVDDGLSPDELGDEEALSRRSGSRRADVRRSGVRATRADGENRKPHHGVSNLPPGERRAALALDALYQFRCARARHSGVARACRGSAAREEEGALERRVPRRATTARARWRVPGRD